MAAGDIWRGPFQPSHRAYSTLREGSSPRDAPNGVSGLPRAAEVAFCQFWTAASLKWLHRRVPFAPCD